MVIRKKIFLFSNNWNRKFICWNIYFFTRDLFINLFNMSLEQKELLSNLLALYIIYLPVSLIDSGFFEMVRLKNDLKLYRNSLILFIYC